MLSRKIFTSGLSFSVFKSKHKTKPKVQATDYDDKHKGQKVQ